MKTKATIEKILIVSIGLLLLSIVSIVLISILESKSVNKTAKLVTHTQDVLYHTERLLTLVIGNETGSRGYVITGNQSFLEPLKRSKKDIYKELATLKELTNDNPPQQARVDSLSSMVNTRFAFSDSTIAEYELNGRAAALALVETGRGKLYSEQIRKLIDRMEVSENNLLVTRKALNESKTEQLNRILLSVILVILVLLAVFIQKLRNDFIEKKKNEAALLKLNNELEQRVSERTKELERSGNHLVETFERITDAFIALDKNFCYTYVNKRTAEIAGRSAESMIGKNIWEEFPDLLNSITFKSFTTAFKEQRYIQTTDYYAPLDFWMETHVYPSPEGISVFINDISESKKSEEKIVKANRLYFFISQINQMIVRTKDEKMLFREACRIAVELGQFRMAWIGMLDESTQQVIPVMHAGEEDEYLSKIKHISVKNEPEGMGPTGRAIREGKYFICNDIESDPDMAPWKEAAMGRNYLSSMALPITKFGKVIGAFSFYASSKNFFDDAEIGLLVEATGDVSFALEVFEKETLRKKAEEAVLESEKQYHTLAEVSPVGIFHTDASGYTTYVNPSWCRISGLSYEQALGNGWLDAVHEEDRTALSKGWEEATEKHEYSASEYRFVHPDGSITWVMGKAIPERNSNNEIIGFVGTTTDITERKKAEEEINRNEKRFRALIENSTDGLTVISDKGNVLDISPSGERILGYKKEALVGEPRSDLVHPDDQPLSTSTFHQIIKTPKEIQTIEHRHRMPDGTYKWLECTYKNLLDEPSIHAIVLNYRDISERKNAALKIKDSEERYRKAEAIGKMGNWELNIKTGQLSWSDQIFRIFDIDKNSTRDNYQVFLDSIHPEDMEAFNSAQADALAGKRKMDFTHRIITRSGDIRHVHELGELVTDENAGIAILTGTVQDITEQVKAQHEILKEKNLSDSIINSLPGVFYLYNRQGNFLRWNRNFEKVTLYNSGEIKRMHPLDFFNQEEKEVLARSIDEVFHSGEATVQAGLVIKTKEIIPYYFTGLVIEYEGQPCLMGVGIDFTERVKAQEEIRQTSEQLRQLAGHLQTIREEERKRIGREIHDELGQQLTAIKMDVAWINKKIPEEEKDLKEKLKNTISLLDGSNQSIRRILSELRPDILDDHHLIEAMQWQGGQFTANTGIPVEFRTIENNIKPGETIATCIFRVYQEALTNITRYAAASKVITSLVVQDGNIIVTISDDGTGFDIASLKNKRSFGILGMKERVNSLRGEFELNSSAGKGTKIIIKLPYKI